MVTEKKERFFERGDIVFAMFCLNIGYPKIHW